MNKTLHGAVMGLLIGAPAVTTAWFVMAATIDRGVWPTWLAIAGWMVWGAIIGSILPKHK